MQDSGSRREKHEEPEQDRFQNSPSQQSGCYIVLSREVQELSGVHRCSCSLLGLQGGILWFYSGGVGTQLSIASSLVTYGGHLGPLGKIHSVEDPTILRVHLSRF